MGGGRTGRFFTVLLIPLVLALCLQSACPQPHRIVSRATIQSDDRWKLREDCGFEFCGSPKGDHLFGEELKVRVEALNASQIPQLVIRLQFLITDQTPIRFISRDVTVQLSSGRTVQGAGYECKATLLENPVYRRSVSPLQEVMVEQKYDCIDLYFDVPPPSVEDVFMMRINGVWVRGKKVNVPEITFRKGVARW